MFLIIKHIDIEGPGTMGDFLNKKGIPYQIIELGANEPLPVSLKGVEAVVVLGGPMNVDEQEKYAFLKPENEFIQNVLNERIPYLGICLGAQLLAKAAGAKVVRSPVKEIGWYHISLTQEGKTDRLFNGFRQDLPVYHWHGDMFMIPQNGVLLATAPGCPHQAIRVGENAYGVQFHVEVTDKSIREWCDEYVAADLPDRREHARSMLDDYQRYESGFRRQADLFFENFLKVVKND